MFHRKIRSRPRKIRWGFDYAIFDAITNESTEAPTTITQSLTLDESNFCPHWRPSCKFFIHPSKIPIRLSLSTSLLGITSISPLWVLLASIDRFLRPAGVLILFFKKLKTIICFHWEILTYETVLNGKESDQPPRMPSLVRGPLMPKLANQL